jgi:hypothetical protein
MSQVSLINKSGKVIKANDFVKINPADPNHRSFLFAEYWEPEVMGVATHDCAPGKRCVINLINESSGSAYSLNGFTNAQTLTIGSGMTHVVLSTGQTFGIATSYGEQFAVSSHTSGLHSAHPVNSLFAGTNISGTINSTAFNLSVAAQVASGNSTSFGYQSATPTQTTGATSVLANNGAWVTVITTLGNYLTTAASSNFAINSLFAGTNISGTVNSTAFNLSVAAGATILGAHAGTAFTGTNISGTLNSTGVLLNVAAPTPAFSLNGSSDAKTFTANSGLDISVASTGITYGIATSYGAQYLGTSHSSNLHAGHAGTAFSGTNISGTINSTGVLLSVGAAVGGGITAINGQTAQAQTVTVQSGLALSTASNAWTFGLSSNYINASVINTTGASTSYLAADGSYRTLAPGGGGITAINAQTALAQTITVQSGLALSTATNAWTVGLSSNYLAASNVVSSGSSNSFLAGNGTYYSIAGGTGAAPGNISNYVFPSDVFHGNIVTTLSTPISTNITIRPFKVTYNIEFTKMEWPVSIAVASTTNNTARTQQLRHTAVIYSKNGAVLTPIVGAEVTYSYTVSSASTGSVAGARFLSAPLATTLTPGDYWVGIVAQTAGIAPMTLNHMLVSAGSQMAGFLIDGQSITTANFASTGPFAGFPLQGIIAASISNTTNTWNISAISVAPASYYRANMIFQFKAVSY